MLPQPHHPGHSAQPQVFAPPFPVTQPQQLPVPGHPGLMMVPIPQGPQGGTTPQPPGVQMMPQPMQVPLQAFAQPQPAGVSMLVPAPGQAGGYVPPGVPPGQRGVASLLPDLVLAPIPGYVGAPRAPMQHGASVSSQPADTTQPCRHFQEGKCNRRKCRFMHSFSTSTMPVSTSTMLLSSSSTPAETGLLPLPPPSYGQ